MIREVPGILRYGVVLVVVLAASLVPLVGAQSPRPFEPLEMGVPDGLGPPLGFGDVNGDGAPDLIVAGAPFVLLNDGNGLFTAAVGSAGWAGAIPRVVDRGLQPGRPGRPPHGSSGIATVSLWFGTPSGALVASAAPLPSVPANILSVAAGDIDGRRRARDRVREKPPWSGARPSRRRRSSSSTMGSARSPSLDLSAFRTSRARRCVSSTSMSTAIRTSSCPAGCRAPSRCSIPAEPSRFPPTSFGGRSTQPTRRRSSWPDSILTSTPMSCVVKPTAPDRAVRRAVPPG